MKPPVLFDPSTGVPTPEGAEITRHAWKVMDEAMKALEARYPYVGARELGWIMQDELHSVVSQTCLQRQMKQAKERRGG